MAKLDRLGWADGLAFSCHDARIGIRVTELNVLGRLPAHLPPGWAPDASPVVDSLYSLVVGGAVPNSRVKRFHVLYAGAGQLARTLELDEVLETLESHLDYSVAVASPSRLFVRAGVVGYRGQATVVLGPEGVGTSAFVRALVGAGATYYSDRFAVFDTAGRVHPYPKRLSSRDDNSDAINAMSAGAPGDASERPPLYPGLIVVAGYKPGSRWHPRTLSAGQAVLALMERTVPVRLRPAFALRVLERAVAEAITIEGRCGEAVQIAGSLLRRLERRFGPRSPRQSEESAIG